MDTRPFDPFDYAQGRLRSGQALIRAGSFAPDEGKKASFLS